MSFLLSFRITSSNLSVLKKSVWISFGRKTEEAKGDWRKLCNYKINLSFPLNFITISKSR